jgi:hypothetical protein
MEEAIFIQAPRGYIRQREVHLLQQLVGEENEEEILPRKNCDLLTKFDGASNLPNS